MAPPLFKAVLSVNVLLKMTVLLQKFEEMAPPSGLTELMLAWFATAEFNMKLES